jgi:hypothetical protein
MAGMSPSWDVPTLHRYLHDLLRVLVNGRLEFRQHAMPIFDRSCFSRWRRSGRSRRSVGNSLRNTEKLRIQHLGVKATIGHRFAGASRATDLPQARNARPNRRVFVGPKERPQRGGELRLSFVRLTTDNEAWRRGRGFDYGRRISFQAEWPMLILMPGSNNG